MNLLQGLGSMMKGKSGKKLALLTVLTSLLAACIVIPAVLYLNNYSKLKLLDQYICEGPSILEDRENELDRRSAVFEEDALARGELGAGIWSEELVASADERLQHIRDMISAESVSLVDEGGAVLNTTGIAIPAEVFEEQLRAMEPRTPVFALYQTPAEDDGKAEQDDGSLLVMIPLEEEAGHRLVFEFSCKPLLELHNTLVGGTNVLERMLSGLDAYAYIRRGDGDPVGFPLDDFTEAEKERLDRQALYLFQRQGGFLRIVGESSIRVSTILGKPALAVRKVYPERDTALLFLVPLWSLIATGVYSAAAIVAFIIASLILFSLYVFLLSREKQGWEADADANPTQRLSRRARAGRVIMFAAVGIFSAMLILLESRATTAFIGSTRGIALQSEIDWYQNQGKKIRSTYTDLYRTRAESLAKLLTEHREYRTRKDLQALCGTIQAEYLMLFDETGQELLSTNSYTGFSAAGSNANLSEEYRAVLLGYPSVVVGPEADPYTGKQKIGAAALLTQTDGLADGFLLAVFGADEMEAELEAGSLENTVNTFALSDGQKAAMIDNESHLFLAHTDRDAIGLDARYYLEEETYGADYSGFTEYDERDVYVCGTSDGAKSLLLIFPARFDAYMGGIAALLIAIVLMLLGLFYCPRVCRLIAEKKVAGETEEVGMLSGRDPIVLYSRGYALFFSLFAAIAFLGAYTIQWPAFTFIYGGFWSRGVHLFAIWAAILFLAGSSLAVFCVRVWLRGAQKRSSLRTRTVLKLADSMIAYAAGILIVAVILYMFGVNTVALLASAGIVSIAVGMGAKDIVSDTVAGLFLIIEDSIHIGDQVSVGSWKGTVTDMGIRTTKITDESGNVKILNNNKISDIVNMSRKKDGSGTEETKT